MYPILQKEQNGKYRMVGETSIPQRGFTDAENYDKKSGLIPLRKNQRDKYNMSVEEGSEKKEELFDLDESGDLVKSKK